MGRERIDASSSLETNYSYPRYTISDVIRVAAKIAGVNERRFFVQDRQPQIVKFRAAIMWILRNRFKLSTPEIGKELGRRDHSTVLYHLNETCIRPETIAICNRIVEAVEATVRSRPRRNRGAA